MLTAEEEALLGLEPRKHKDNCSMVYYTVNGQNYWCCSCSSKKKKARKKK